MNSRTIFGSFKFEFSYNVPNYVFIGCNFDIYIFQISKTYLCNVISISLAIKLMKGRLLPLLA